MPGTRSYHQFTPLNQKLIGTKRISEQVDFNPTYNFTNEQIASGEDRVVYPCTGNKFE